MKNRRNAIQRLNFLLYDGILDAKIWVTIKSAEDYELVRQNYSRMRKTKRKINTTSTSRVEDERAGRNEPHKKIPQEKRSSDNLR